MTLRQQLIKNAIESGTMYLDLIATIPQEQLPYGFNGIPKTLEENLIK